MKKIIMSIIVTTICCVCLCACGKSKQHNSNYEDTIQMLTNFEEATLYFNDSNAYVIEASYAMKVMDWEKSIVCFKKALELVKDVKARVSTVISSPNFISKELEKLEKNYDETISKLSEEEIDEAIILTVSGTYTYKLLFISLNAFSYLYEIRTFEQLPDNKANLKNNFWKFGFNDFECPEIIGKQDLYLIWAKQFFEEFDVDTFLREVKVLREHDNLSSPEYNQKWTNFIQNFILATEEGSYYRTPS